MVRIVHERHNRDHQIATIFHPDAEGEVLETKFGSIRTVAGGAGSYQLTTGEIVSL